MRARSLVRLKCAGLRDDADDGEREILTRLRYARLRDDVSK
jgi:hypothetical protein